MTTRSLIPSLAAVALCVGGSVTSASADVGTGNPVGFGFGLHPFLRPVLHPTVASDTNDFKYTAKGYFKIGDRTVARLGSFSGTATNTPTRITLKVSTYARHIIRAEARRRRAKRTTLTIVSKIQGPNGGTSTTYTSDVFLIIPKT